MPLPLQASGVRFCSELLFSPGSWLHDSALLFDPRQLLLIEKRTRLIDLFAQSIARFRTNDPANRYVGYLHTNLVLGSRVRHATMREDLLT